MEKLSVAAAAGDSEQLVSKHSEPVVLVVWGGSAGAYHVGHLALNPLTRRLGAVSFTFGTPPAENGCARSRE